jgi:hypothetical protein
MPEWQGAGVGIKFLNAICEYHLEGYGRKGHKFPTFFHTSHPQLCGALRKQINWAQTGASLYGSNKARSRASIIKSNSKKEKGSTILGAGYGGHFRAVQAFKYIGDEEIKTNIKSNAEGVQAQTVIV